MAGMCCFTHRGRSRAARMNEARDQMEIDRKKNNRFVEKVLGSPSKERRDRLHLIQGKKSCVPKDTIDRFNEKAAQARARAEHDA